MSSRRNRAPAVAVLVGIALLGAACLPPPPPPGSPTGACRPDPFTAGVVAVLDGAGGPQHHLTIAAYDDRTGCWYHYRRGQRVTTASVVKAEILAGVELRAQLSGRALSVAERARVAPMIGSSDNASASALFSSLGGEAGLERIGAGFGLDGTDEVGPVWGLTTTTAEDQARFMARLVHGPGPLDEAHRADAWRYLVDITPAQRWGVRAGVPGDWVVGHKNGFAGAACCGWRVNSVGYVADPAGGGYGIAVLSDGWPSLGAGIPMVEAGAAVVAAALTAA